MLELRSGDGHHTTAIEEIFERVRRVVNRRRRILRDCASLSQFLTKVFDGLCGQRFREAGPD